MRYDMWRTARSVEAEFTSSLLYLLKLFEKICKSSGSDVAKYENAMNNFQNSLQYKSYITSVVKKMVTPLANGNYRTWREAARKQTQSKLIYNSLMAEINEGLKQDINDQIIRNAEIISTLPSDVANKVVKKISEEAFAGERAESIANIISGETKRHARASAKLIARTEVSKTTTALTKARSENLGLKWYVWRTALDGDRVRKSHRIMEGVLVRWDNPPSPESLVGEKNVGRYHAGEIWNCRCYPEPLISVDEIKWPHKVYLNERIESIAKEKFIKEFS